jgi:endoglucanase
MSTVKKGLIVSMSTAQGAYLSDGKLTLGTADSGEGTVIVTAPDNFLANPANLGSPVTLQAFIIDYTHILENVTTAWTKAMTTYTKKGVTVVPRPAYGDAGKLKFVGVNIPGGEDLNMPSYGSESAFYFRQKGMNFFNLFTSWAKLQSVPGSGVLNGDELNVLTQAVEYITNGLGAYASVEFHDFGRFQGAPLGSGAASADNFAQIWGLLAEHFKSNPRVLFSLMNQPHDQNTLAYVTAVNAAIAAIRATGSENYVLVQSSRWNSAMNFNDIDSYGASNAEVAVLFSDSKDKTLLNVHQYFDASKGGAFEGCVGTGIGVQYLSGVTTWLRANNKMAVLGEFGASDDPVCKQNIEDVLRYVSANSDVWAGWAWWNAGTYLSSASKLSIEPIDGVSKPQEAWLKPFLRNKCPVDFSGSATGKFASCSILSGLESAVTVEEPDVPVITKAPDAPRDNSALTASLSIGIVAVSALMILVL